MLAGERNTKILFSGVFFRIDSEIRPNKKPFSFGEGFQFYEGVILSLLNQ